jgi:hypothetical protein
MRVICEDVDLVFVQRPYAGPVGAALYVGFGPGNVDERVIEFRRRKTLAGVDACVPVGRRYDLGRPTGYVKTPAVDLVKAPDAALRWTIPPAAHGQTVWAQVRTHADDWEHESLYRARRLTLAGDGDGAPRVGGTLRVLERVKRVGGGLRLRCAYAPGRDGLPPEQFTLRCTAGPTSPAPVSVPWVDGRRLVDLVVDGLTHGGVYTFAVDGVAGEIVTTLASGIVFTADAEGPPAVAAQLVPW